MSELEALDTIGLLQDEVARLEEELRLRDEAAIARPSATPASSDIRRVQAAEARVKHLDAELAGRDETIDLLSEQVRKLEESQAALLADWKDVEQWVEQLEQQAAAEPARCAAGADTPGQPPAGSGKDCAADEITDRSDPASDAAPQGGEEAADLRRRLQQAETMLNAQEAEFAAFRERTSSEIEGYLREIEALKRRLEQIAREGGSQPQLSPDERIRALRRHLMDIHVQECEERRSRTLMARLTRLLQHTAI